MANGLKTNKMSLTCQTESQSIKYAVWSNIKVWQSFLLRGKKSLLKTDSLNQTLCEHNIQPIIMRLLKEKNQWSLHSAFILHSSFSYSYFIKCFQLNLSALIVLQWPAAQVLHVHTVWRGIRCVSAAMLRVCWRSGASVPLTCVSGTWRQAGARPCGLLTSTATSCHPPDASSWNICQEKKKEKVRQMERNSYGVSDNWYLWWAVFDEKLELK